MNQAKSLIQQIGPYVEDQEYLQLIVLLQMLKPPKKWIDPTTEFLSPAQKKSNQTLRKVLDIDPQAFKMENQTR